MQRSGKSPRLESVRPCVVQVGRAFGLQYEPQKHRTQPLPDTGTRERVLVELDPSQAPNPSDGRSEPDVPQPSLQRVTAQALDKQDVWQTLKIVQVCC